MRCPDCQKSLKANDRECSCGWVQPIGPAPSTGGERAAYQRCEWQANGERCRYPGSMSTNTHEGGPYFCREHFACKDPAWGVTVVEASRDYRQPTEAEMLAEHTGSAQESLKAKGLARRDGESVSAWIKRTKFWMREQSSFKPFDEADAA